MTEKNLEKKVEGLYDKKKLASSLVTGEVASAIGSGLGARLGEKIGGGGLGGIIGGGILGDYLISAPVGCLSWLYQNREYYKGFKGKVEWLKDESKYLVRELPAVAGSYLAYAPILALLYKGVGLSSWLAGGLASVLVSALYIGGSMMLGKGVFTKKKVKEGKKVEEPKEAKESPKAHYRMNPGYNTMPAYNAAH